MIDRHRVRGRRPLLSSLLKAGMQARAVASDRFQYFCAPRRSMGTAPLNGTMTRRINFRRACMADRGHEEVTRQLHPKNVLWLAVVASLIWSVSAAAQVLRIATFDFGQWCKLRARTKNGVINVA